MQGHHCQSFWEACDEPDARAKPGSVAQSHVELCSASAKPSDFFPTVLQTFAGQVLSRMPLAILFPFAWVHS